MDQNLLIYNIKSGTISNLGRIGYSGVTHCYDDSSNHGITFVASYPAKGTKFWRFSLIDMVQKATYSTGNTYFEMEYSLKYISMSTGTQAEIYQAGYLSSPAG